MAGRSSEEGHHTTHTANTALSFQQLLCEPNVKWDLIEDYISLRQPDEITQNELYLVLRYESIFVRKHGKLGTNDIDNDNEEVDDDDDERAKILCRRQLQLRLLHVVKSLVEKNPNIVDRNALLAAFSSNPPTPIDIVSFLLQRYHKQKISINDDSSGVGTTNNSTRRNVAANRTKTSYYSYDTNRNNNWAGKFLCDTCFGYCQSNSDAVRVFLGHYPQALTYSDSGQKLLPIHKACQLKYRRRAKQESDRDYKSLFQVILCASVRNKICGVDNIGGLFKLGDNKINGFKMLVDNVGEDMAWDWVRSALGDYDDVDVPILQAVLIYNAHTEERTKWLKWVLSNFCNVAQARDSLGNVALHAAIGEVIDWDDGLGDIIEANPNALEEQCKRTGHLPFISIMLLNKKFELSTLYCLIRFHPSQLMRFAMHKSRSLK